MAFLGETAPCKEQHWLVGFLLYRQLLNRHPGVSQVPTGKCLGSWLWGTFNDISRVVTWMKVSF